jgi:hypothetical protein
MALVPVVRPESAGENGSLGLESNSSSSPSARRTHARLRQWEQVGRHVVEGARAM